MAEKKKTLRNTELSICEPGALRTRVVGAKKGGGRKKRPRKSNRKEKETEGIENENAGTNTP